MFGTAIHLPSLRSHLLVVHGGELLLPLEAGKERWIRERVRRRVAGGRRGSRGRPVGTRWRSVQRSLRLKHLLLLGIVRVELGIPLLGLDLCGVLLLDEMTGVLAVNWMGIVDGRHGGIFVRYRRGVGCNHGSVGGTRWSV